MRQPRAWLSDQPVLLGATTILLSIVAIYIVYHAHSGLPFVPTYNVWVVLPDAQNLGRVGDVRIAGTLVGHVRDRRVEMRPDGTTRAVVELTLEKKLRPLPADTKAQMRAVSTLGGNYVELLPGRSREPLRGDPPTIHAERARPSISLHDSIQAYDAPTRQAVGEYLGGYGDALAGRGSDLNAVFALAPGTLKRLDGAMRVLSSGSALGSFIESFARFNEAMAPVGEEQAGFVRGLHQTLGAMASVRGDVAEATATAPAALQAGIDGFPAHRRLLRRTRAIFAALRPAFRAVRPAADDIGAAASGSPAAFRALRRLSPRLEDAGAALRRLGAADSVVPSLTTLLRTFTALAPTVSDLRAAQVVCNYPGVLLRNLLSAISDGTPTGNWLSTGVVFVLPGPNSEAGPAAQAANGPATENHLHATPAPLTGQGDAPECESGNERYEIGRTVIGSPPGRQPAATETTRPPGGSR
jgi:ABC-type transporter Mla subunit MlaD